MKKSGAEYHTWSYILSCIKPFPAAIGVMIWVACIWAFDLSFRPYLLKVILNRLAQGPQEAVFENLLVPVLG